MSERDYYEVLGVSKNTDAKAIKKAYKRLAMKHHPDRNKDNKEAAEKTFKEIQKAYGVLSDEQKRQAYDQFGHAGVNGNAGGGGFGGGNPFGGGGGFGDIFGDIFGGGRQAQPDNRGSDLRYDLEIDLKEAAEGKTVQVRIPKGEKCNTCHGTGARTGTSAKTCGTCHGAGQVHMQQGPFTVQQPCPQCKGAGQVIESPCGDCHGKGVVRRQKTLSVKIPVGVDSGNRIRLTGEGEAGTRGGPSGDLYVEIHVRPHNIFERRGNDLYCGVPIDFASAALGGDIEVPTLNGKFKIKIPSGTQTGRQFRLKGKGITGLQGSGTGDLICQVKLETPVNLNGKQRKLLQQFSASCGKKQHPESDSFFGKMKSFFE
ncbi:Chaperone protein DnaJ [Bathymodiolus thermophilus thioautotrophic gill symbiont]|uniref:Chaperone protein DnaJ n=1 Tax=Bathymodiolus thermophilus thioautotrophic gill symbiont TaxID=2360 RepID=A0A1J5TSA5_9GAMM|nr:molecular chaperone DnaJ [Bathymodiolus thermophilus thioautotrophic gill symbiont]AYQ57203.1 Chaperone protein DnaJ [Bathymodiolus thermophilus thioautotrophic gill symbiont]OIR23794.1 molecular chaperone DnaJ [Bathymodiolus thermophilus thioautotrophic gill symbiont]CAB5500297.1 Chaperone protein DnaJ [Bathymodiolus thermophilus thioautotrophic gill symbiont]